MEKNIILIGHPGSGKTTIGKELSNTIKMKFFDIDEEIENKLKIKINKIFNIYGEKYFRTLESKILKNFIKYKNIILSTGAGIIDTKKNINILKNIGIIIYLKLNIETCINRIINDDNKRPLFKNYNNDIKNRIYIKNLLKNREIIYDKLSNIIIDIKDKKINKVIKNILEIIYEINN